MLLGHEKISFLHLPTPLEKLDNLSEELGINLYIKRDDWAEINCANSNIF